MVQALSTPVGTKTTNPGSFATGALSGRRNQVTISPAGDAASVQGSTSSETSRSAGGVEEALDALAVDSGALSGGELLDLQARVFHEAIRVELFTRVADRLSGGARQLMELR